MSKDMSKEIVKLTALEQHINAIRSEKISRENAEKGVDAALKYYRTPLDSITNKDKRTQVETARDKCVIAAMEGRLEFVLEPDDDGLMQLTTVQRLISRKDGHDQVIRYREIDGKAKKAMKACEDDDSMGKIQAMMASLAGVGPAVLEDMRGPDIGLAESLGMIFLSV